MDVYAASAGTMWRRPDARAVRDGGRWLIEAGDAAETVIPADVPVVDEDVVPKPIRLRETLHECVRDLLAVRDVEDPQEQAERLAEHYRRFAELDLCIHARPIWHADRGDRFTCQHRADYAVDVDLQFIRSLDAVVTGGRVAFARRELPGWVIEDLAPLLDPDVAKTARGRQVMELATTHLLRDAGVEVRALWSRGRGPGLALVAPTTVGLYALDIARALGREEPAPTYTCGECGGSVQLKRPPAPGEGIYCRRAECQRARYRVNKQRARARAKGADHVQ
jgi:hypothetical protein